MKNTNDLVQQATHRKFTEFDSSTKEILNAKVAQKLQSSGYFSRLDIAKGLTEKDETTEKEELSNYEKEFLKILKNDYDAESPADLSDSEKKEFFNKVEKIKKSKEDKGN